MVNEAVVSEFAVTSIVLNVLILARLVILSAIGFRLWQRGIYREKIYFLKWVAMALFLYKDSYITIN
jgi:hypothetical protein